MASEGKVVETVVVIVVFVLGDIASSSLVRVTVGSNNSIIGSIVSIVVRIVGRIIIIMMIITPTSTELKKEYGWLLASSKETDLEGAARREGMKVSVMG